ncbi:hypothetical protein JH26_15370 [Microvirga sp. BSC39]|nr:hypothetical protein JH26_15370 [Microvirga sp. BSC39]
MCQLCNSQKKLCDAHIIPWGLYPKSSNIRAYTLSSNRQDPRPKGVFDRNILCAECDRQLGRFDDYAAKVLLPWPRRRDLYKREDGFLERGSLGSKYFAYWIKAPDIRLLQGFAASLLWRSAVTSRDEIQIELGLADLERTRRVFEQDDRSSYFDILVQRMPRDIFSKFVSGPVKLDGAFQFCMSGVVLNIYLKRHDTPPEADCLVLGRTSDLLVGFVPFWGSKFEESFREIVMKDRS